MGQGAKQTGLEKQRDDTDRLRLQPRLLDNDSFKRGNGKSPRLSRTLPPTGGKGKRGGGGCADKTLVLLLSHPIVITYTRGT